ncbi:MAG: hypothetical protein RIS94_763 [Pseudomonadota bacterium]
MRLLILGLNYAPEPVGIGPYTTGFAEDMAARGHEVTVVAGKPYYPQWRAYEGQPQGRAEVHENGVSVTRVPHYIPENPTGARRIVHHMSFAASAYRTAMAKARDGADLVFTVAPSLLSVPVAARAARAAGAPLWLHVQDFEVEAAFATGLVKAGSGVARTARNIENRILGLAQMVSTISPQMCARLLDKGVAADRIYQLRNWSNAAFFGSASHDGGGYRSEWGIGGRKVALYSGNIANKQGIEIVIDAARMLKDRKDLVIVICGEGPNRARLADLSADLPNVQLHDLQPAERMGDLLSLASVHLLPQIPGAADLVLPSKLTNMLQSGRPVVATAAPGTGLYAEVSGCGVLSTPGDAEAFAAAIAGLLDDPAACATFGAAALARAQERWSRGVILDRFEEEALRLVGARANRA